MNPKVDDNNKIEYLPARRRFITMTFRGILSLFFMRFMGFLPPSNACGSKGTGDRPDKPRPVSARTQKGVETVIAVQSATMFTWDGNTCPYVEAIDQEAVDATVERGIMELARAGDPGRAWRSFLPYKKGERILIKPNLNWIGRRYEKIVTSPQVVNSVIRSLIHYVGAREKDIWLYDVSRPVPSYYRDRIPYDIRIVDKPASFFRRAKRKLLGDMTGPSENEIKTLYPVHPDGGSEMKCFLPKVLAQGDHLINLPILKAHPFLLFSGAMKNHFGSIVFDNGSTSPRPLHGEHISRYIVDVHRNSHLRKIERLVIGDAIAGTWSDDHLGDPERWKIFGENYPGLLFFSRDALEMDLRLGEIVGKERAMRGLPLKPDAFLRIAQEKDAPRVGSMSVPSRNAL